MAARLKVFVTSDGLTDFVVATTSKAKALAAWGSHQDLFKTGLARETDDPALVQVASQRPGEVLRRPAGTRERLATLKPARRKQPSAAPPSEPSKAALKKIADLEKKLAVLDAAHLAARRKLEERRSALELEMQALDARHQAERARWAAALEAARQALPR